MLIGVPEEIKADADWADIGQSRRISGNPGGGRGVQRYTLDRSNSGPVAHETVAARSVGASGAFLNSNEKAPYVLRVLVLRPVMTRTRRKGRKSGILEHKAKSNNNRGAARASRIYEDGPVGSRGEVASWKSTTRSRKKTHRRTPRPDNVWCAGTSSRANGRANAFARSANRRRPGAAAGSADSCRRTRADRAHC